LPGEGPEHEIIRKAQITLPLDRFTLDFVELLKWMLSLKPDARPTANEVLCHPLIPADKYIKLKAKKHLLKRKLEDAEWQIISLQEQLKKRKLTIEPQT